jgi:penicillin-binding protein 1A
VRSGAGQLVWRWDRDGKKPVQVIPPQVAVDMVGMMIKVVEEGTARRAILDGIKAAGKTGTTNAYRDAWFVGFTGNFVCGVWFGNDDYTVMHQMTGGSLPAQTWHEIMAYAHQGVELKSIPGIGGQVPRPGVTEASRERVGEGGRPSILTRRGTEALLRVEQLMDDATRALATSREPTKTTDAQGGNGRPEALAAGPGQQPPGNVRGN